MKKKKIKLKKSESEKINYDWKRKNGCSEFDFKEENMIIFDGGLFPICERDIIQSKFIRFKKLPNGNSECIFSKKKYPAKETYVPIWFPELTETIQHLQRAERLLKKLGYDTDWRKHRK